MALSDRIALLRVGELEQVSTPREIYSHPATAYTAQFVGQTNLLRATMERGVARCGILTWRSRDAPSMGSTGGRSSGDGPATFSLRPESIRLRTPPGGSSEATPGSPGATQATPDAPAVAGGDETVRFSAAIRRQVFGGATDLLEVACADGRTLLARIPSHGSLQGEWEFEFCASAAVRVRDERGAESRESEREATPTES